MNTHVYLHTRSAQCMSPQRVLALHFFHDWQVKWPFPEIAGGPAMRISYSLFVSPPPPDHVGPSDEQVSRGS
jgi:hypothetical protein